jgi:hypothetical protein
MKVGEAFELADGQSYTDTSEHSFTTAANDTDGYNVEGRMSTVVVKDSHNQAGTVKIYGHPIDAADKVLLYSNADLTGGGSDYFTYGPYDDGAGGSGHLTVAALAGPWFKLTVSVTYSVAPASGSVDIDVYSY